MFRFPFVYTVHSPTLPRTVTVLSALTTLVFRTLSPPIFVSETNPTLRDP